MGAETVHPDSPRDITSGTIISVASDQPTISVQYRLQGSAHLSSLTYIPKALRVMIHNNVNPQFL